MVPNLEYHALNRPVLDAVPTGARRILDLGCGAGALGRSLKTRQATEVIGVTYSTSEADEARIHLDRVVVCDINNLDSQALGMFDCVICSHVLEHLYWPQEVLQRVRPTLIPGGHLIVALPNPLVWRQRLQFLLGRFRYTDGGLMDSTHFRFFDWTAARAMITDSGYNEISATADGGFPLARFLPVIGHRLSRAAVRFAPGFFGWQFVIVAEAGR